MLVDIATNSKDPSLQEIAVQSLAIYHPKDSAATLVQIYKTTSDAKVKRSVINGLFIARDATRLVDLARNEKDLNMKRDIVSLDDERRAAMVSNLLVVLCADRDAQPIVNAGSLYQ